MAAAPDHAQQCASKATFFAEVAESVVREDFEIDLIPHPYRFWRQASLLAEIWIRFERVDSSNGLYGRHITTTERRSVANIVMELLLYQYIVFLVGHTFSSRRIKRLTNPVILHTLLRAEYGAYAWAHLLPPAFRDGAHP